MKYFFILFFCLCSLVNQKAIAKTLHALIVADTGSDMSLITRPDATNIQNELKIIAKHTESILKEKVFMGSEFKKEKVIDYIHAFQVDPSDVVVFYFSGHGYRTMQQTTPWPCLSFEFYKIGIDMQWVVDTIWEKKPQLALIMSDCCNNYVERGFNPQMKNVLLNLHKQPPRYLGYRQLFSKAKGCIAISSCSAGQFSYGCCCGGLFTNCFLASLNKEIAKPIPSWKCLLERATQYIGHIQRPICKIYH